MRVEQHRSHCPLKIRLPSLTSSSRIGWEETVFAFTLQEQRSNVCFDLPMNRVGVPRSSRMIFAECKSSKLARQWQLIRGESSSNGSEFAECRVHSAKKLRAELSSNVHALKLRGDPANLLADAPIKPLDGASMRSTEYRFTGTAVSTSWSSCYACDGHCGFPGSGSLVCSARRPSLSGGDCGVRDILPEVYGGSVDGREMVQARWYVHGRGALVRGTG